jgi:hypothetical protein
VGAGFGPSVHGTVSLWSDFAVGRTYGLQYFTDGSVRRLIGAINVKA